MREITAAMLSVSGCVLTDEEKLLLKKANPMGITLFKRNIADKEQVKTLISSVKQAIERDDVLIAADQEGGRVCRFSSPHWDDYVSQYALASLDETQAKEMSQLHAFLIANDLKQIGVNWNYAPVLDVAYSNTTQALQSRIFSSDEKKVAELGKILTDTYKKNGICPCVKHLPGHGRATVDPHLNLPILSQPLNELEKDFYPFTVLAQDAPAGMTAHMVISCVDDKPITQSKKAIENIIRGYIGFKGFLISDAIDMKALKGSLTDKVKTSLDAGCDAVCYCFGIFEEMKEVVSALRPLTDEALMRFEKIKKIINQPLQNQDIQKAKKRYKELSLQVKTLTTDYDAVEVLHEIKEKNANKKN